MLFSDTYRSPDLGVAPNAKGVFGIIVAPIGLSIRILGVELYSMMGGDLRW